MCDCNHDHNDHQDNLAIGAMAPDFTIPANFNKATDKKISLSDYKGKWVLLFFYPLDFTFVCPTELYELGANREQFEEANCQILGVSVDSVYAHQAWSEKDAKIDALGFPLLSDLNCELSYQYNVLHPDGMSLRGAFIIDPDGYLQAYTIHNLNVGRNAQELLRTVKALQTGDLCPANWNKGEKTLGKA